MVTVYFQKGQVVRMTPAPRTSYYDARAEINAATDIVSDGIHYDLSDKRSIYSIKIPQYQHEAMSPVAAELGVTGSLEYVLRMHAGFCWNQEEFSLAIACLGKANQLMVYSSVGWPKKDYYRIVNWLEELGRFEKAEEWEAWIERNVPSEYEAVFQETLSEMDACETDLVYTPWSGAASAVAAKYQARVYSFSGKDRRFPSLPKFMKQAQGICPIKPFVFWGDKNLDTIFYKGKDTHVFKASWRPFVDDRSAEEIAAYEKSKEKLLKSRQAEISRRLYYRLKYFLPDDVPKSSGAFSRMRNSDSPKYKALIEKAEKGGFVFPRMDAQLQEPDDPDPNYAGGHRKPLFLI